MPQPLLLSRETLSWDPQTRLSAQERDLCGEFPAEKRRQDWALGRAAAKEAVAGLLAAEGITPPAWDSFSIESDVSGAPRVRLPDPRLGRVAVSISHGHGHAVAWALRPGETGGLPGVDLELVRPRPEGTLRFFLQPAERAWVVSLPAERATPEAASERDLVAVLLWSLKEAAFKAIRPARGVGLRDVLVELQSSWLGSKGQAGVVFGGRCGERAAALGVGEVRAHWERRGELFIAQVELRGVALPE